MKPTKWTRIIFFTLISSFCRGSDGLDIAGCGRLREICRELVSCDFEVLYQECGKFMRTRESREQAWAVRWNIITSDFRCLNSYYRCQLNLRLNFCTRDCILPSLRIIQFKEDAIPPMSLVKAWLLFPETLNPYHSATESHRQHLQADSRSAPVPPVSPVDQWPNFPHHALGPLEQRSRKPHEPNDGDESDRDSEEGHRQIQRKSTYDDYDDDDDRADDNEEIIQRVRRVLKEYKKLTEENVDHDEYSSRDHSRTGAGHHDNRKDGSQQGSSQVIDPLESNLDVKVLKTNNDNDNYEFYNVQQRHNDENVHYVVKVGEGASKVLRRANGDGDLSSLTSGSEGKKSTSQTELHKDDLAQPVGLFHNPSRMLNQLEDAKLSARPDSEHLQHLDSHESKINKEQPQFGGEVVNSKNFNNQNKEHLEDVEVHKAADLHIDSETPHDKESPVDPANNLENPNHLKEEEKYEKEDSKHVKKHFFPSLLKDDRDLEQNLAADSKKPGKNTLILQFSQRVKPESLKSVGNKVQKVLWGIDPKQQRVFTKASIDPNNKKTVHLRMHIPHNGYSSAFSPTLVANKINTEAALRNNISKATGLTLVHAKSSRSDSFKLPKDKNWDEFAIITAIVGGCTLGLIVASVLICSLKRRYSGKIPIELQKKEALTDYEELCRTQMAVNETSPRSVKALNADKQRHGLVDGQGKYTKKTWREEPLAYNMDISTGHVILAYMEDHLKNEDKLSQEWEALCNYKADQDETTAGEDSKNTGKNRYSNMLPYDHTRVKLRETSNVLHSDYINASFITDTDPRNPAYIATQGPLDNTVADFWQMIWEQGVVVIVNLTRLSDMGLPQCHRYWPEEGSEVYNTYQVHLISEHIWCDDYIVRSFYLKHLATQETRTITQFHFLTWPDLSIPESAKPLLEFRRKVNKCYRGQACPIVVHCNNGVGRTGTYILIDMVLKKMIKGTKEIDIAATLEHLRDQRPDMVKTKAQFEFCLASVAEEITIILSSLSN